ncbi:MAG: hypothetical protein LCH56_05875 [Proteobacteria bacterium]|nr:hypothetical protein [Pseudomonadota bacterium]
MSAEVIAFPAWAPSLPTACSTIEQLGILYDWAVERAVSAPQLRAALIRTMRVAPDRHDAEVLRVALFVMTAIEEMPQQYRHAGGAVLAFPARDARCE